jgi:hypothetical protein
MYYIFYGTVNLKNGMHYYGKHTAKELNDSYLGSGIRLLNAVKKYGKENFKRYNIYLAPDQSSLNVFEESFLNHMKPYFGSYLYNISLASTGGNTGNYAQVSKSKMGKPRHDLKGKAWFDWTGKTRSDEDRKKKSEQKLYNNRQFKVTVKCPHCEKEGQLANMKRWHFDECKRNTKASS